MTATTVTGLIRQALTVAGLDDLNVTRDEAEERATSAMPYAVTREGISRGRTTSGRHASRRNDLVQVDLSQTLFDENPELLSAVWVALELAPPTTVAADPPYVVYRLQPTGSVRAVDSIQKTVTEHLTVRVVRSA